MNYEALFARAGDRVVRAGLVGVGDFGASLLAQSADIANLEIVLLCDRESARTEMAIAAAGLAGENIRCVGDLADAGDVALDVLVEATGNPAAAVDNALHAISAGWHVVMVSKEADILVGPMLHLLAHEKGLVYTAVDGDQPSLLIGLVSWARILGLDIIAAGKSSEYDFVLEADGALSWFGRRFEDSGLAALWSAEGAGLPALAARRADIAKAVGVPTRTAPDYCEMGVVANATGLAPDRADFHAPILRPVEVADTFQPAADGGMLRGSGRIDVFNCLRRHDEASFAGGVFVVVACQDAATWDLLREKGHMVAKNGKAAMLYNPQHLLGIEAPMTILGAALLQMPTGGVAPRPRVDLVARTERNFQAGETLTITNPHHHEVAGLLPELAPATAIGDGAACPYYLAVGQTLSQDVAAGTILSGGMLELPAQSSRINLRRRQDRHFGLTQGEARP